MPSAWQSDPFPHAVIDGLWPEALLLAAAAEFPGPDDGRWESAPGPREGGKRWCDRPAGWGPIVKQVIGELRSDSAREWLTDLTATPRVNRAARDWSRAFFAALHGYGIDAAAAFSMELRHGDPSVAAGIAPSELPSR